MNLQQAKALFFAQYLGQPMVSEFKEFEAGFEIHRGILQGKFVGFITDEYYIQQEDGFDNRSHYQTYPSTDDDNPYLLLRSVSQLTDEELQIFAKHSAYRLDEKNVLTIGRSMVNHMFELNNWSGNTILYLTDYLRSIGVLIPFTYIDENNKPVTLQPDEIISLGWAKHQS